MGINHEQRPRPQSLGSMAFLCHTTDALSDRIFDFITKCWLGNCATKQFYSSEGSRTAVKCSIIVKFQQPVYSSIWLWQRLSRTVLVLSVFGGYCALVGMPPVCECVSCGCVELSYPLVKDLWILLNLCWHPCF